MLLRPKKWTHHHTHRIYHISLGICFTFIALVILYGIFLLFLSASADNPPPVDLQLSAQVAEVNTGPTTVSGGGGAPVQQPLLNEPYVTIDSPTSFDTSLPQFFGLSNIANANIYVQIQTTGNNIDGTTSVDSSGRWSWNSIESLRPGTYHLLVTAIDPNNSLVEATATQTFVIQSPNNGGTSGKGGKGNGGTPPIITGQNGTPLYVSLKIPELSKIVPPGAEIFATVKFVNLNNDGKTLNIPAEYIIDDSNGNLIMDNTENVAVKDRISLLKTFYISGTMPEGEYTLIVKAPFAGVVAESSDTFQVKGNKVISVSGQGRIDLTVVFQCLIAMFLFFAFIAYFEYYKVSILSKEIKRVSDEDLKNLDN